jgi:hypothetical protein
MGVIPMFRSLRKKEEPSKDIQKERAVRRFYVLIMYYFIIYIK